MTELKYFISSIKDCADRYRAQVHTAHPALQELLRGVDALAIAQKEHENIKPKRGRPPGSGLGIRRGRYN